jgi:hypothetical protein
LSSPEGVLHAHLYRLGAEETVSYELIDILLPSPEGILHAHLYRLGAELGRERYIHWRTAEDGTRR